MSAVAGAMPSASRTDPDRSIDDLDQAICRLASRINAVSYQLSTKQPSMEGRVGPTRRSKRSSVLHAIPVSSS